MIFKSLLIAITTFFLFFSSTVYSKKPENKNHPHHKGNSSYWKNSNKQSDAYSLKGKARADKRHQLKKDQYEHQRHTEKYRNNPITPLIKRTIDSTTSKIDEIHHRAIESIGITNGNKVKTKQINDSKSRWWWPF